MVQHMKLRIVPEIATRAMRDAGHIKWATSSREQMAALDYASMLAASPTAEVERAWEELLGVIDAIESAIEVIKGHSDPAKMGLLVRGALEAVRLKHAYDAAVEKLKGDGG